ncbi:MAG: hypothetical protein GWN30_20625, partial [Gammaproteobacteria bacterium]|nr:hypothetical protein [Gammaproteobacteria bacterium]NIX00623.1 hypothetical protein [Phycisphaerae bacterium]
MPVLNSLLRQQDKIPQQNRLGLMGDMRQQINSLMQHRPAKGMPTLGEVTEFGVQASPFVGDALALEQAGKDFKQGNYGSATFNAATALPVIGDAATAAKVALPALTSLGSLGAMMRMGRGTPPVTPFSKMQGVIGGSASPPKSKNADDLDIERVIKRGGTGSGFSDIEVTRVNGVADVSVEQSGNIRLTNPEKSTQWAEYSPGGELVRHGQDFTTRPDEGVLSVWNETAPKIALRIKRNSTKIPGGDVYVRYGR